MNSLTRWFFQVFGSISVLIIVTSLLFEVGTIPTPSMEPTISVNDSLIISKPYYGIVLSSFFIRNFSPKLIKVLADKHKIFRKVLLPMNNIKRGDIISFIRPNSPEIGLCKRVIGCPGDEICVKQGVIYVNNVPSTIKLVKQQTEFFHQYSNKKKIVDIYEETLPGETKSHSVMYINPMGNIRGDNTPTIIVPKDYYYIVGDFREKSFDSRLGIGLIHKTHIIGSPLIRIISSKAIMALAKDLNIKSIVTLKIFNPKKIANIIKNLLYLPFSMNFSRSMTLI